MKFVKHISILFVILLLSTLTFPKNIFASSQFTDLGSLGGQSSQAHAINDNEQIVGESFTTSNLPSLTHAFLWENGVMTDLGTLPGFNESQAFDINNSGKVVGVSGGISTNNSHAFLWENGVMTDLGTFGGTSSAAVAINNNDQIVGYYRNLSGQTRAFLWDNGIMTDLGTLGGNYAEARDINDVGQIVGYSTSSNNINNEQGRAFIWQNGIITNLGVIGGFQSSATSINNQGVIVGYSTTNASGDSRAVMWNNNIIQNLGTLSPNLPCTASSINNGMKIIGSCNGQNYTQHASLWQDNNVYDLGMPNSNAYTSLPISTNNAGQIVGSWVDTIHGGYYHAYLEIPQTSVDIKFNSDDGPAIVPYNWSGVVAWTSELANSCQVSPSGFTGVSSSQVISNIINSQTFTINCTGIDGQTASDTVTVNPQTRQLTLLTPIQFWIGLKNSDDVGIKFDLKAEAYKDNTLITSGELNSFSGGSSGFNNAHLATINFDDFPPLDFPVGSGSQLKIKLYARNACTGSGHNSGTARLWYNDSQADNQFNAVLSGTNNYYHLLDNFILGANIGSTKKTVDVASGAKCSAFKTFGTWTVTSP